MKAMDKKKFSLIGFGVLAAAVVVILAVTALGGRSGGDSGDSSVPALTVTADSSAAEVLSSAADVSSVSDVASAADVSSADTSSSADSQKEYKQYQFRSKKLYESHYEKHGAEFGSITKEEYLKLANDLLNSDSPTVLHKPEKEDGDDVFFDTATGYFLVLSTDGYIRTFFIPDKGIEYYNKQ
jgi:pyocin large subunit-like protein